MNTSILCNNSGFIHPVYSYKYNSFRRTWEVIEYYFILERYDVLKAFSSEKEAKNYIKNLVDKNNNCDIIKHNTNEIFS